MNLLIPLLNSSTNDYYELRHAIRSICKHNNIHTCTVVGGKPRWYTGSHIPFPDYPREKKEENIRDKVLAGAKDLGRFLFANDDHFMMAPYMGILNKGLLSETAKGLQISGSYTIAIRSTMDMFGDVEDVDTHYPMVMDYDGVKKTVGEWPKWGLLFKTTYAQLNGLDSTYMPDNKVKDISTVTGKFFSTSENCRNITLLSKLFHRKSPFEK